MNTATTDSVLEELARVKAERDAWGANALKAQQEGAILIAERDRAQSDCVALANKLQDLEKVLHSAIDELRARTAERDALAARLEVAPAMREVIGELRKIHYNLVQADHTTTAGLLAQERLKELLRRLDRES